MIPLPYRVTNLTRDRVLDADTAVVAETNDVLGTFLTEDYPAILAMLRDQNERLAKLERERP